MAITHLEQFNEEVMKKIDYNSKDFGEMGKFIRIEYVQNIITQKLTEHKALILKIVKERVPSIKQGSQNEGDSYAEIGWNECRQEFLNNLDTI